MKTLLWFFIIFSLFVFAGCEGVTAKKPVLMVDFQKDTPLKYKFVSSRQIKIVSEQPQFKPKKAKTKAQDYSESMEMVVEYKPIKVDPYGLTIIEATCKSVKAKRNYGGGSGKDAVENLAGKSFTFTVGPTGKIEDYSDLEKLIKQIGKTAFKPQSKPRVKKPDMINDFIATQWFLWNSVSSLKQSTEGVSVGQSWESKLALPTPMRMRKSRNVSYALSEIRPDEKGQLAVINSTYTLNDSVPQDWLQPYTGRFQMSGPFGFYRGYKVSHFQGQGQEIFNIDKGRIEQYNQSYKMRIKAGFMLPLPVNPVITIDQKLTMQLLEN